jgi:uridine monophosphate synthetase
LRFGSRDELLEAIWRAGLVLLGRQVREQYALGTPIFIDLRHKLYEDVALMKQLGVALHRQICALLREPVQPQQVLGIPDTATPLALSAALASLGTPVPLIYGQMRKKPAAYPGGVAGVSAFMGTYRPDREITLIDDVMASGRSKLWAIEELAKNEIQVTRILVVVDREQGGDEILTARGYPVHSLYTITEVLDYFVHTGKVEPAAAQDALDHLRAKHYH